MGNIFLEMIQNGFIFKRLFLQHIKKKFPSNYILAFHHNNNDFAAICKQKIKRIAYGGRQVTILPHLKKIIKKQTIQFYHLYTFLHLYIAIVSTMFTFFFLTSSDVFYTYKKYPINIF